MLIMDSGLSVADWAASMGRGVCCYRVWQTVARGMHHTLDTRGRETSYLPTWRFSQGYPLKQSPHGWSMGARSSGIHQG